MFQSRLIATSLVALAFLFLVAHSLTPAQAQGANLLLNAGFNGPYSAFTPITPDQLSSCPAGICQTAQVPISWQPWWKAQKPGDQWFENRMPEFKQACPSPDPVNPQPCPFMNRVKGGEQAAQYFSHQGSHFAGYLQQVAVPANANLKFSVWGMAWSSDSHEPVSVNPSPVNMRVGIDPTGGTDPYSANIVWSGTQNTYDQYVYFEVQAVAKGSAVTVFTYSNVTQPRNHNDIYWDEAYLGTGGSAPSTGSGGTGGTGNSGGSQPAQQPLSLPTPTPDAEGYIKVIVQSGDTLWTFAARAGLTLAEFLELNNLGPDDVINPGDVLILGKVEPAGSTSTAPDVANTEEITATATPTSTTAVTNTDTITPSATATPEPTATAAPAGGMICLRAFDDTNSDGILGTDEPLKEAVAFTISNGEQVVSNYITDGLSEPFCIEGLTPGNYRISRSLAAGEKATSAADWGVAIVNGSRFDLDFGSVLSAEPASTTPAENLTPAATAIAQVNSDTAAVTTTSETATTETTWGVWLMWGIVGLAVALFIGVVFVVMTARKTA